MKTVLVTGANGHLGYTLVGLLKAAGYEVRAGVRGGGARPDAGRLTALGAVVVDVDILRPETIGPAVAGVEGVFHVAAAYKLATKNPKREVWEPAVTGALSLLKAAEAAGVRKVVMTSSTTAVGSHAASGTWLTEKDWNADAIEPYARAKTEAERLAWEFANRSRLELVTILPSAMIGPGFFRHTPTTQSFGELLRGRIPVILPLSFSFVDVRDAARAHIAAYENDLARGRYIVSTHWCSLGELFALIHRVDPEVAVPSKTLPESWLPLVPALDWVAHLTQGTPRFATRAFMTEYAKKEARFSSNRAEAELGWRPRDFEMSVRDTLVWLRTDGKSLVENNVPQSVASA